MAYGGGWKKHPDGLDDVAAIAREEFDGFVERGRIGAAPGEDGLALDRKSGVASGHFGTIAPDGVDFAVVGEQAAGLRTAPGGCGVGGIALVEDSERGDVFGRGEVGIEVAEERTRAHGLVDEALTGEGTDVPGDLAGLMHALELLACEKEAAFHGRGVGTFGVHDENLADDGHGGEGDATEDLRPGGDVAPAEDGEILRDEASLDGSLDHGIFGFEEDHADAEDLSGCEGEAAGSNEIGGGDAGHEADAVGAFAVGGDRAAMGEAAERGGGLFEDGVGGLAIDGCDEAYAAGVEVEALVDERRWKRFDLLGAETTRTDMKLPMTCP